MATMAEAAVTATTTTTTTTTRTKTTPKATTAKIPSSHREKAPAAAATTTATTAATAAATVGHLVAVQTVLHFNWFDQELVMDTARRILGRSCPHPDLQTPPFPRKKTTQVSQTPREPFTAAELMLELQASQVENDEQKRCCDEEEEKEEEEDPKSPLSATGSDADDMRSRKNEGNDSRSTTGADDRFLQEGGASFKSFHRSGAKSDFKNRKKKIRQFSGDFSADNNEREKVMSDSRSDTQISFQKQKAEETGGGLGSGAGTDAACRDTCTDGDASPSASRGATEERTSSRFQQDHAGHGGHLALSSGQACGEEHVTMTDPSGVVSKPSHPTDPGPVNFQKTATVSSSPSSPSPSSSHHHQIPPLTEHRDTERRQKQTEMAQTITALRTENARLKALRMCRQCRTRPANLTLLPCGHFCLCAECGATFSQCPCCGKTVLADVKTYVA